MPQLTPVSLRYNSQSDAVEQRQMFADMANNKPIDRLTGLELDGTDPFNNVARQVARDSVMLEGRVHPTKGAPARGGDEWLVSKTDVKTIVTMLDLGLGKSANASLRSYYRGEGQGRTMCERSLEFFDEFLPQARDLFHDILEGGVPREHPGIQRHDNWELEPIWLCRSNVRTVRLTLRPIRDLNPWNRQSPEVSPQTIFII